MKKLLFSISLLLLPLSVSFAQSYPSSCPAEAQSVLKAVGGCDSINSKSYYNIYSKCCMLPQTSTTKADSQAEAVTSNLQEDTYQDQKDLRGWEPADSAITDTSAETGNATPPKDEGAGFVVLVKNIFTSFFKLFRFGR